ncbi:unnamed protein product [Calypogeia fissa]
MPDTDPARYNAPAFHSQVPTPKWCQRGLVYRPLFKSSTCCGHRSESHGCQYFMNDHPNQACHRHISTPAIKEGFKAAHSN